MTDILENKQDGVLTLTLNRTEKMNALTFAMYDDLAQSISDAQVDDTVRVIVINANGDHFCAGNDIADFIALNEQTDITPDKIAVFRFLNCLVDNKKPLLAAVQGNAIGIGLTLMLHCDFAYATESAVFQSPFINLGVTPEAASTVILPALIGRVKANDILLNARKVSGVEAAELGLINQTIADKDLQAHVMSVANGLVNKPQQALMAGKALICHDKDLIKQVIYREAEVFLQRLQSDEAQAIFQAFINRK